MPNPFAHLELTTDDLPLAQAFYKKLFAWKLSDVPGMNYTMIDVGGGTGGGMQAKPMPEAPSGWMPYVLVDDVNATLAKAEASGGKVMLPYTSLGKMGAMGVLVDPTGCALGVWEMSPEDAAAAAAAKKAAQRPAKKAVAKKAVAKKAPAKKATKKPAKANASPKKVAKKAGKKATAKKRAGKKR